MASPQVRTVEYDLSQRVPSYPGMYGLIIGNFDKGPIGVRTFISNINQSEIVLGKPAVGSDIAYYGMHSFLSKSKRLWAVRVADNPLYGGVRIGAQWNTLLGTGDGAEDTFTGTVTFGRCHPGTMEVYVDVSKVGYDDGTGEIDGTGLEASTINYETGAVEVVFTVPPPVGAKVYAVWGFENESFTTGIADPSLYSFTERQSQQTLAHTLKVYEDKLVPDLLLAPTVAPTGASDATVVVYDGVTPIAWAGLNGALTAVTAQLDTGVGVTNEVDYPNGEIRFTLASGFTPTGVISAKYYSTKSDVFIMTGDNPGAWTNNIYTVISRTVNETNTFEVTVYERNVRNIDTILERYVLSREYKKDGFERQMYLEERVNDKSYYIRFKDNPYIGDTEALPNDSMAHNSLTSHLPHRLGGGTAGSTPSVASYITALKKFNNKEDVKVDIIIDSLSDVNYQLEIVKLCDRDFGGRADCYGVLYVPYEIESSNNYVNDIINYRKYDLNISSSFAGLYSGHVKIYDSYNGRQLWIPNAGFVAAAFSYTADQFEPWFPAAGWRRGMLPVLDLNRRFTLGERDALYDNDVNVMRFRPGKGIAIWGQKTLYGRPSALDRANVRWLLIVVENAIEEFLEEYEFELNDDLTRALVRSAVYDYLASIRNRRGLYDFDVVCDTTNNSPEQIDNYVMNVDYYLQPVKAAEYIYGRAVITRTGVDFADVRIQ